MSRFFNQNSEYLSDYRQEIDFDAAIRLPDGGSICDLYRTKWHRHEVFVKRLKEEYRSNPLYLDAIEKEYEIGASLKHPSLPDYREFHRDYIVMDYIDGSTLAEMIEHQDSWLMNEKNIIRLLRELINVVDYLHRHNVTHCDIKPDNIIITANNKNLILIDLDKCYSDSLNDTSGDPSKYGLTRDLVGRIAIDYHGIARVLNILKEKVAGFKFAKYAAFEKECNKSEPSTDNLLQILDYKPGNPYRKFYWMVTFAPFFVALIYGGVLLLTQGKDGYDYNFGIGDPAPQVKDSVKAKPTVTNEIIESEAIEKTEPSSVKTHEAQPVSKEQIHIKAQEMASQLDKRIQPYFDELGASLDSLEFMKSNPEITTQKLSNEWTRHMDKEDEYYQETFEILKEMYPALSEREAWRVLAYSKAYTNYKRRVYSILKNRD